MRALVVALGLIVTGCAAPGAPMLSRCEQIAMTPPEVMREDPRAVLRAMDEAGCQSRSQQLEAEARRNYGAAKRSYHRARNR